MSIAEEEFEQEKQSGGLDEYLRGPKKKKHNYIIFAYSQDLPEALVEGIPKHISKEYPKISLFEVQQMHDMKRVFNKQISLFILDDEFMDIEPEMNLVLTIKHKKAGQSVPFLFLTKDSSRLIDEYQKTLATFQEVDDYVNYKRASVEQVTATIDQHLNGSAKRRGRRFEVEIPLHYLRVSDQKMMRGKILDLSIHGVQLETAEDETFKAGDQLRLHIPVGRLLPPTKGEFIRISGRVRRVFIGGKKAGVSFEYLSEGQLYMITEFVSAAVNHYDKKVKILKAEDQSEESA